MIDPNNLAESEGTDRPAILTFRHLDGILTAEEAIELNALLRESPRNRLQFIDLVNRDALMVEMAPAQVGRSVWMKMKALVSRRWIGGVVLIVMLAMAALIAWVALPSLPPSNIRLASIDGVVRIWRDGVTVPSTAGQVLFFGDRIEVISGTCHVGFADNDIRLELGEEASLLIRHANGRMSLRLDQGRLSGEGEIQGLNSRLEIESPHAKMRSSGAKFTCTVSHGSTSLSVRRGVVTFATLGDTDQMLATAGRVLTTDGNHVPRDASPPALSTPVPQEIPRRWQIDAASAVAAHGRGWQGMPVGEYVKGVVDETSAYQLVSPPASESGLVAAGPGLLSHVHLQVAKPCNVGVLLMVHDAGGAWLGNIQAERLIHADQPQELVLAWDDFRVVSGIAKERLAQGVIGQMMIMCWEKDAGLKFSMASLEK